MGELYVVRLRPQYLETDGEVHYIAPRFVRAFRTTEGASRFVARVEAGDESPPGNINPFGRCGAVARGWTSYLVPRPGAPRPAHPPREWPNLDFFWGRIGELSTLGLEGFLVLLDDLGVPCPTTDSDDAKLPWHTWWREHVASAPASARAAIWGALDKAVFFEVITVPLET